VFVADYEHLQTVDIVWSKILSSKPKYTAIMCVNDLIAYYVYELAERDHINIPEDISVTGFDGITFPRFVLPPQPSLTTAKGDRVYLGRKSVELLLDLKPSELEHILLPSEIIVGKSVKRIY
jgi:DNA-binding LacI/PurR family transcriptional regulator